jgi:[NiFe] hydrogenase diaphorase moiety small subunit
MENQRLLLYFTLFFIVYLLWAEWQMDYGPKQEAPPATATATGTVEAPQADAEVPAAPVSAVEPDLEVENETAHITKLRRDLVGMLFNEGNHLCPICEASGNCELQAIAYRLGMTEPTKFPYLEPCRPVDASHPDIALDNNRCISCGRCVRASQDVDGKGIFGYVGRGIHRHIASNGADLAATDADVTDFAISAEVCPVGCIIRKREGFARPIGERDYDKQLIGHEIEKKRDE